MSAIIIGGCLFLAIILISGRLTPGYSHTQQSISELGMFGTVYGRLVRWVGFVPLGLSFMAFAFQSGGLFTNLVPSILFFFIGLAILFAGIFPTDPENRRDTIRGKIHASAVIALLLLLSASPFMFSISAIYKNPPSEKFLVFSFLMGLLLLTFLILSSNGNSVRLGVLFQKAPTESEINWQPLLGLQQRLLLFLHFIWWFVFFQIL
ncbi:MAG TPA: hypothetical protein DCX53_07445 [Anaerolineae bacterium]|nr:hypothetical protein [Anaerolineae bacterium]